MSKLSPALQDKNRICDITNQAILSLFQYWSQTSRRAYVMGDSHYTELMGGSSAAESTSPDLAFEMQEGMEAFVAGKQRELPQIDFIAATQQALESMLGAGMTLKAEGQEIPGECRAIQVYGW